jgi:hypothetical protein
MSIATRQTQPWGEQESAEGAICNCKFNGVPGKQLVITSITGSLINLGAVAAPKAIRITVKGKGTTEFSFYLQQSKTEGVGGGDRFTASGLFIPMEIGESVEVIAEAGSALVKVVLDASGFMQ